MKRHSNVLRRVSVPDAFFFFTDAEQYTGCFATSLTELVEKLGEVPLRSIEFHFQRGDFVDWVGRTLGANDLSKSLRLIDRRIGGEELMVTLRKIIQTWLEA